MIVLIPQLKLLKVNIQLLFIIDQMSMRNIAFFILILILAGCDLITIEVGPHKKSCTGVAPMMCLQVKFPNQTTFGNFYSPIQGWNFVDGKKAVLLVNRTFISKRPMDSSSYKYTLVKVVSTSTTNQIANQRQTISNQKQSNSIDGTYLLQFAGKSYLINPVVVKISNNQIGFSYCNRQVFSFTLESNLLLKIRQVSSTKFICGKQYRPSEEIISKALISSNVYIYHYRINRLYLLNGPKIVCVLKKN